MPDHTTTSAAQYLTERGYLVHSKRDGTDLPPSPGTIKQWCERGKIKARKASEGGWVWLIAEEELDKLLRKDKMMGIQEGDIVTELFILGPQDVRVLTVNRAMNYVVVQFRNLDQPASEANTKTVTLDKLREKDDA